MEVIPAVDIKDGQCVRLVQGDFAREVVYGKDPVKTALHWEKMGAKRLHVVDLDGAKNGKPCNLYLIKEIVATLKIPVQLGGGIRSLETMELYLDSGVDRVIAGTAALENPDLLEKAVSKFGAQHIVAGVDAREGKVAIEGWQSTSTITVREAINKLREKGVRIFIYTDISRDGMLTGPDLEGLQNLLKLEDIEIIASGGISSKEDLKKLAEIGIEKAIVGKALYEDRLNPEQLWS